jgi:putative ABC transport system permease protein
MTEYGKMKIYQVAYKNLLRKKVRSGLTLLGIALSAWVLVSLFGFNRGYEKALNRDIDNMGFQVLVTAKGCPYEAATLMLKGGTGLRYMNESIVAEVLKHSEVERITPMLMAAVFDPNKGESGGISAYLGVDPATYPQMKSYLKFQQGAWFKDPQAFEAVVGYEAAELEQREVGDKMLIPEKNVELTVVGVLSRTGTQDDGTIFVPLRTVQKVFEQDGKLTAIGVKIKKDANITLVEQKLYDLPDVQVVSLAQVKETIMNLISTAKMMVFSIALIAILIAMLGVVNTILMSVFERFQEIGIIKSIGAMPWDVFKLIWVETIILCLLGGGLGIAFSFALSKITETLIRSLLPYTPTGSLVVISGGLGLLTMAMVLGIGIVSGLYPAWRAARVRPLESIRSEGE